MERLVSFSRCDTADAELCTPRTVDELCELVASAARSGRRIVLRGSGLSFDAQSVDDDLAVSLAAFTDVAVDGAVFTAGAGALWGAVYQQLLPRGLCMPAAVTTSHATVGGTLSANSLSRFSPILGKEGKWVESVDVVCSDGSLLTVSRSADPALFHAVVGGFGGVAVVVSATYRTHAIPVDARVSTSVARHTTFDGIAAHLRPTAPDETAYVIASSFSHRSRVRASVLRSRIVGGTPVRPMLPHRPANRARVPIEIAVNRFPRASSAFWRFAHDVYLPVLGRRPFVDEFADYTFFMDGHYNAWEMAARRGLPFSVAQQTALVPPPVDVGAFLDEWVGRFAAARIPIALIDIEWLPQDEPFDLSSTRDGAGYACTFSFEGPLDRARLWAELALMTASLHEIGGRVHLVKNVCGTAEVIEASYAAGLRAYAETKRRVDPANAFQSRFLRRCFPSVFGSS